MYRLGIDVGGTNTDCAILDENLNCIGKIKSPTMENVSLGIDAAIQKILAETRIPTDKISVVMLGTTHCTNAIVQRKEMSKVGIIRLAKPATTAVAPMVGWPEDLAEKMNAQTAIVSGGYEYNGNKIAEVNDTEIREVCQHMKGKVEAVAVVGVFSPVNREQEKQVAAIVEEELAVPVTLSSEIGSIGLLERENASILNAALTQTIQQMKGFPRESSLATVIGGIRTNFRMPDVLSIGLGGGTIVHVENELRVGPESLGYRILEESLSFGGDVLCTTDIAIANQKNHPVDGAISPDLEVNLVNQTKEKIRELIEDAIDQMKTDRKEVPVILVGGGSIILPKEMNGVSEVIVPENYDAANAIGAALGEVSGEVNSVYSLENQTQEEAVSLAIDTARKEAIDSGASVDTLKTIFVEVIPLAYLPKQAVNIKVKVAGKLSFSEVFASIKS